MKRLTAAFLATSALVFGVSVLAGNGRAQSAAPVTFTCSAADKQFITTVSANLTQLSYWSDALISHDVAPAVVVKQAKSEAVQVGQTRPQDRTLHATRDLLGSMFLEYSKAVAATVERHERGQAHGDRVAARPCRRTICSPARRTGSATQGCDVSPSSPRSWSL